MRTVTQSNRQANALEAKRGAPLSMLRSPAFRGLRPSGFGFGSVRAFTLIELLVVIAVISLLASMIFPVTRAVARNKTRNRARVEMARIQAAVESYKAKLGHYPPDSTRPGTNQLFYELVGTTATGGNKNTFTTLDGSSTLASSTISAAFGVGGFVNSTQGAGSDEAAPALAFLTGLKPDQTALIPGAGGSYKILIGSPWKKLPALPNVDPKFTVDPIPVAPGVNPWRYRCHTDVNHPTLNNPDSYDLWLDVNIGGTVFRISNWSLQPQKVTSSLDK